jgi:hypothetical protein
VPIPRRRAAQEAREEDLARRRGQKICAPHDVGDAHCEIVHGHRQLIREDAIAASQDEIPHVVRDVLLEAPHHGVVDGDHARRHAQPNGRSPLERTSRVPIAARPRIHDLFSFVRRARDSRDLGARAVARVGEPPRCEVCQRRFVQRRALRLRVRCTRSAHVGSFVPREPHPAQIVQNGSAAPGHDAWRIEIFHAKEERAVCLAREIV